MDNLKELASKAATTVDETLDVASSVTRETIATAKASATTAYKQSQELLEQSRGILDQSLLVVKGWDETVFQYLRITRRILYRQTFGRLRSPEDTLKSVEQRLQGLSARSEDYTKEYQKLQARAVAADEEMRRGMTKLRATRSELQRLASQVGKSEKAAHKALVDLREVRSGSNLLALRGEAAAKLASLRSQRMGIEKSVHRIVAKDL